MSARSKLIKLLPCICCEMENIAQVQHTDEHHLNLDGKAGQKRLGDSHSIPLCAWHHQGYPPEGMTASEATFHLGPSLARSSKRFRDTYGRDEFLLEITNERLRRIA